MVRLLILASERLFGDRVEIKEFIENEQLKVQFRNVYLHDGNARIKKFIKRNGFDCKYVGYNTFEIK